MPKLKQKNVFDDQLKEIEVLISSNHAIEDKCLIVINKPH